MKKRAPSLTERKKRDIQRNLDEAGEMTQRRAAFRPGVPTTPPKLEGSRILLLMVGTSRCLYASLYALYLSYQLRAELYILHKGSLASLVVEHARELQVTISVVQRWKRARLEEIQTLVQHHAIDLIVASSVIPNARELLSHLHCPVLFTSGSYGP